MLNTFELNGFVFEVLLLPYDILVIIVDLLSDLVCNKDSNATGNTYTDT